MKQRAVEEKAALAAALGGISGIFGWRGSMALIWVAAMVLDYISGSASACKAGKWSSAVARQGLWHKGGMILVVMVSAMTDLLLTFLSDYLELEFAWPGCVFPMVLAWYIITELGSILENAVKMGAPVPEWLMKILRKSLGSVNAATGMQDERVKNQSS